MNNSRYGRGAFLLTTAALCIVAMVDFFVPTDVQFVLLYLAPLTFLATRAPIRLCFLACLCAAAAWWTANLLSVGGHPFDPVRIWNTFSRFVIFFSFVSLLHYYRWQASEKEEAMQLLRKARSTNTSPMGLRRVCSCCGLVQTDHDDWVNVSTWLSRDYRVFWADSSCPTCSSVAAQRTQAAEAELPPTSST